MVTVAFCKKEMAKRSRTPDDKISNLPDEILVQILSSLPTKQVFQTSLLSRRWKHLRRHVPTLRFQHSEPSDDEAEAEDDDQREEEEEQEEDTNIRANFVGFVNKALTQLLCPNLKKLSLAWTIKYTDDFDHADDWTRFAIKRRVEELTLNVHYWHACCGSRKRYVLPEDVFNMPFLEKLSLEACCVLPRSALCWESLRVLKIKDSVLCSDHVLSKIPMLEYLELTKCTGFSSLSIVQERLRKLVIDHAPVENFGDDEDITEVNWDVAKDFVLDVKSPNIQALEIMGEFSTKIILPGNLMSLVDVKLDFCFSPYKFVGKVKEKQDMLRDVLLSLRHAQCLHLGLQCSEILPVSWEKSVPYPVLNCKFLTLEASIKRPFLSGIFGLLQNSPNLEILKIDMRSCDKHQADVSDCTPGLFEGLVIHPKTIKIIGFDGSRCGLGLSFILALLRTSCAFAKMVIDTWYIHNNDKYYDQLEVAKILLASRRDVTIAFGR